MLTLYVMRHAKSSWDQNNISDFERPLSKRGQHNAKLMAKVMKEKKMFFDIAYVSGAKRTVETFRYIKDLNLKKKKIKKDHYLTSIKSLLKSIQTTKDKYKSVLILNHEPLVSKLTHQLCSKFKNSPKDMIDKFSTGAVAIIQFEKESWEKIRYGDGKLEGFIKPKYYY